MRNWLRTRKIMAKIDREEDIYVIADRLNQAIRDIDGEHEDLDKRIHALELDKTKRVTESGVHRIIEQTTDRNTAKLSKKAFWGLVGIVGSASAACAGWVLHHIEWK